VPRHAGPIRRWRKEERNIENGVQYAAERRDAAVNATAGSCDGRQRSQVATLANPAKRNKRIAAWLTQTIRLWMDLGRDGFKHEHYSVSSHEGEVVISVSVTTTLIKNVEFQLGLIERKRSAQVVDNKKGATLFNIAKALWTRI
jgi:hypothetical protein